MVSVELNGIFDALIGKDCLNIVSKTNSSSDGSIGTFPPGSDRSGPVGQAPVMKYAVLDRKIAF